MFDVICGARDAARGLFMAYGGCRIARPDCRKRSCVDCLIFQGSTESENVSDVSRRFKFRYVGVVKKQSMHDEQGLGGGLREPPLINAVE